MLGLHVFLYLPSSRSNICSKGHPAICPPSRQKIHESTKETVGWKEGETQLHQSSQSSCPDSHLPFNLSFSHKVHPEQGPWIPQDQVQTKSCSSRAQMEAMRATKKTPHLTGKPISSTPNSNHRHCVTTQLWCQHCGLGTCPLLHPLIPFLPQESPSSLLQLHVPKSFGLSASLMPELFFSYKALSP